MNLNEYQRLAQRTSATVGIDKVKNGCLGLIGESGEIVDILKKYMFQSGENPPFPKDKFIKEMGDVLWYVAETVSGMGMDLRTALDSSNEYVFREPITLEECSVLLCSVATSAYVRCYVDKHYEIAVHEICYIYATLLEMCKKIDTTIDEVADTNIENLKKRYPDGFDPERSIHRPEYERKEQTESASTHLFTMRNKAL